MRTRRSLPALALAACTAALVLSGCGGGSKPQGDLPTGSDKGLPPINTTVPDPGGPLPKINPAQVRKLVGTWKNTSKAAVQDSFTFKADGTGSWNVGTKTLWTGQLIPVGNDQFRLSWLGKDPKVGTYWSVQLNSDGKLLFQGNQQTYAKG